MHRVAIIGLGLMGGSLGLALKARGFAGSLAGYSRSADRRAAAVRRGAVDEVFDSSAKAARDADMVVFCAPILSIPGLVQDSLSSLQRGCVVTDVGSTKEFLVNSLEPLAAKAGFHFVGSHPIAGSEKQGIDAARADLYDGATIVVTPTPASDAAAVAAVTSLWTRVGGAVRSMPAAEHDRLIARTSHLPHLVAALLAATVGRDTPVEPVAALCGSGFRDTTRVAEGSPEIWRDILATNHEAIVAELKANRRALDQFVHLLEKEDFVRMAAELDRCRSLRRSLVSHGTATREDAT